MTKPTPESGNPIERLLQDRAQFVSWLTRLNATGEASPAVPEAVRSRVRADYERRLDAVLAELRGHTSQLEEQVGDLSTRAGLLTTRENEHKEQLAEAEVRHLVGEYDEGKWDGIRAELLKVVAQIRSELDHTTSEIARLNEVLATIRAPVPASVTPEPEPELLIEPEPVAPSPPPPAVSAPRPVVTASAPRPAMPEPAIIKPEPLTPPSAPVVEPARPAATAASGATEIPFRAVPPRPQPKPPAAPAKKEDQPGRTLWFPSGKQTEQGAGGGKLDELAFLKSVTGGEGGQAPQPAPASTPAPKSRASGGFTKPAEAAPAPAPPPAAEPPAAKVQPAAEPKDRSSGSGQKTLKCGECGTLNRPTEWYCERCGAELAAL